jgi:hypothetical protein
MPSSAALPPATTSPLAHLKRAFTWNLGRITPSASESDALAEAGLTDAAVQRYAVWRRSLLKVALVPTLLVFVLALWDAVEGGMDELSMVGVALEGAWLLAMALLALACFRGSCSWTQPGAAAGLLRGAWMAAFLFPIVSALLPESLLYDVHAVSKTTDMDGLDKFETLLDIALGLALSGGTFLILLPAVLSVIPGAVNGCLRIKSLLPAAQLPGWLLVCAAPVFLLSWLVILAVANHVFQSPLLVLGVTLWAGSPIWYALRGRVFVQSQLSEQDAMRIAGVKRVVALLALTGIACILAFTVTSKVAGLTVVGTDPEAAVSTKIDELGEASDDVSLEAVGEALDESKSFVYAYDLSSWQLLLDVLAKLLLATAVFADLVLRATLAGWKNERALRARSEASGYDASAAAAAEALGSGRPAS